MNVPVEPYLEKIVKITHSEILFPSIFQKYPAFLRLVTFSCTSIISIPGRCRQTSEAIENRFLEWEAINAETTIERVMAFERE